MAIDDLDLEFEDEEEKDRGDALDLDIDLSFSASPEKGKALESARAASGKATPKPRQLPPGNSNAKANKNNIADINQARKSSPQSGAPAPRPQAKPVSQSNPAPQNDAYEEVKALRAEVQALKDKVSLVEQQAEIKVAVAEAEKHYLVEYVSNAKVLDHHVTQMLHRINGKVPQLKGEVQMIKRHMNEFLAKVTPKKKE